MKKQKIDFTIADFTGGGDGVKALYADGRLLFYGDDYHDDIDIKIRGFIEGVYWTGAIISEDKIYANEEMQDSISCQANIPPQELKDVTTKN